MADKRISELTAATAVGSSDTLVLIQGGETKKCAASAFLGTLPSQPVNVEAHESVTSGAVSITKEYSRLYMAAPSGANASFTLAAGTQGIEKVIFSAFDGGVTHSAIVTVTNGAGFTTLTFGSSNMTARLKYINGKWYILSLFGVTSV